MSLLAACVRLTLRMSTARAHGGNSPYYLGASRSAAARCPVDRPVCGTAGLPSAESIKWVASCQFGPHDPTVRVLDFASPPPRLGYISEISSSSALSEALAISMVTFPCLRMASPAWTKFRQGRHEKFTMFAVSTLINRRGTAAGAGVVLKWGQHFSTSSWRPSLYTLGGTLLRRKLASELKYCVVSFSREAAAYPQCQGDEVVRGAADSLW